MKKEPLKRHASELGSAVIEDGLSFIGLPVATSKWAYRTFVPKKLRPEYYFSPNRQIIESLYAKQSHDWLAIQIRSLQHQLPVIVEIDNSDHLLTPDSFHTEFIEDPFMLDNELEAASKKHFSTYKLLLRIHGKTYFDGELARLKSISESNNRYKLTLQPVRYNAVCKTHMCLDAPISHSQDTIRYRVHGNDGLKPLSESRLANALGINILLFTADGDLIMQRRSKKVAVFHGLLGPPSSGDFEADDFRNARTTIRDVPILRESKEELHIHHDDIEQDSVLFLGLTRELARGGKPELFFSARTHLDSQEVKKLRREARDRWESKKVLFWSFGPEVFLKELDENQSFNLRSSLYNLLLKHADEMSLPLLSAIALFQRYKLNIGS